MSDGRWERLNTLFHEALGLGPAERGALLAETCAGDPALRAEVERLLAAHERSSAFIERPAIGHVGAWLEDHGPAVAGRRLGPYRVVREIGRGGMGAVFLGERADGQYEQQVALKLIKRGMDTDQVLARFRAERQILASLDHPNIARLLDGGTSDDGLPYFAMEYIEGEPIDAYADARSLAIDERLRLFLKVCHAVAYAHQRLIVHRDIKPLNILVTADGVPKLLDFGIAKVLHADPDETTATMTGFRLLTPEYASPEQVDGRAATTASDVYSLGVVLYELLTGRSPYSPRSREPLDVAEAVRTTEPERPSTAVGRPGSTDKVRRRLRGDLDTIVLTALRKDLSRRYGSVEQLAGDIQRHLDGQPVQARPDTFGYRAGKFVRRNKVAVVAAALVGATLLAGSAATAWQARAARSAQGRAERRFNDLRKLAHAVLFDYHDAIRDLRGSTPVRERLVRDGLGYLDGLAAEAQNDPSLQLELAGAYQRMGDVQGGDPRGLEDTEGAAASYGKAMAILEARLREHPREISTQRRAAAVALALGRVVWGRGDLATGLAHARRARAILDPLVASAPDDTDLRLQLSAAYDLLGQISLEAGEIPKAIEFHRADMRQLDAAPEAEGQRPQVRRTLSVSYGHLADAQVEAGDLAGALRSHGRSLAIRTALANQFPDNGDFAQLVSSARFYEADVLSRLNRWSEALTRFRMNLAEDPEAPFSLLRVGDALEHLGRREEALAYYRHALRNHLKELQADPADLYKRLAVAEERTRICQTLVGLGQAEGAPACAEAVSFMAATQVEPAHAWPRAFSGALWSQLGAAYAVLAVQPSTSRADARTYRVASRDGYRRSLEIWTDLTARRLVSPADTARLAAASQALGQAEAAVRASAK